MVRRGASMEETGGRGDGVRRAESPMTSASFQLRGLDAAASYAFECADGGETWTPAGSELMTKGLPISADIPRSSRLVFCRRADKG